MTSAHVQLSRIQRAENVVLYWAVVGPGETSAFKKKFLAQERSDTGGHLAVSSVAELKLREKHKMRLAREARRVRSCQP